MAERGRYRHEPVTGYRYAVFAGAEHLLVGDEEVAALNLARFPGCDRFNVNSLAAELSGWTDARRLANEWIDEDAGYPWERGRATSGVVVVYATAVSSAEAWMAHRLAHGRVRRQANLRRGSLPACPTSGGSVAV